LLTAACNQRIQRRKATSKEAKREFDHATSEGIAHFRSLSGIEYKRVYGRDDWDGHLPDGGEYSFTRGIYQDMYRGRLWTLSQQSGFWLIMKAEHFANIHCRNKAALIDRADHALCDFMDNPKKVASAATPIGNELWERV
jgi:methylmalonyl-CoA mutase N-terminal domain/subunit